MDKPALIWRCLLGISWSLGVGYVILEYGLRSYRNKYIGERTLGDEPAIKAWLIGLIERFVFTVFVAFTFSPAVIAMVAWLGIKMKWIWDTEGAKKWKNYPVTSLVGGLISMFFAFTGGLIIRW